MGKDKKQLEAKDAVIEIRTMEPRKGKTSSLDSYPWDALEVATQISPGTYEGECFQIPASDNGTKHWREAPARLVMFKNRKEGDGGKKFKGQWGSDNAYRVWRVR